METTNTNDNVYLTATEVAAIARVGERKAYKVIAQMNKELAKKGYITFAGRIPRKYLEKRLGI
ncbi:MAG: hypothetical protein SOV43_08110 [Selenomonadaceae bacterium]|mgnify:CR=1 FL=1|nr:hypothetical protein [Selenomonadaceae bacterium]